MGLQLPQKAVQNLQPNLAAAGGVAAAGSAAASPAPSNAPTPTASTSNLAASTPAAPPKKEEDDSKSTNVDQLMDAVGISGVDVAAEEEGLRQANERQHVAQPLHPSIDRSRKQDFIEPGVLAECVKKI
ncbi:hypothetical protein MNV49_007253, partial [Pseudohyphozyma bogoriensis]